MADGGDTTSNVDLERDSKNVYDEDGLRSENNQYSGNDQSSNIALSCVNSA